MGRLTNKQSVFVQEYLTDLNATQAAIRAGYSARTADRIGPELLGKPQVFEAVRQALEERASAAAISQEALYRKLGAVLNKTASDRPGSDLRYSNQLRAMELVAKLLGLIDRAKNQQEDETPADDGFMEALQAAANDAWADYDPNDP